MYRTTHDALSVLFLHEPECPHCGTVDVSKNGTYERHLHGRQDGVQLYCCDLCGSFSPSHPSVEDDHRYTRAVTQLADAVEASADVSLEGIQYKLTVHYGIRPTDQHIHNYLANRRRRSSRAISPSITYQNATRPARPVASLSRSTRSLNHSSRSVPSRDVSEHDVRADRPAAAGVADTHDVGRAVRGRV